MEHLNLTKEQKIKVAKSLLEAAGYTYEHPTLILEGKDGWLVILTPGHAPHQAIVHLDSQNKPNFWSTIPEMIE